MSQLEIGSKPIEPGHKYYIDIPLARLPGQSALTMPTIVVRGKKRGPVLWVSSAVHGDEINGVEVIRRLLDYVCPQNIRGTLIAVPIVNVFGFSQQSRYLPDRRDLNRSFPGNASGSLAARLAHLFMKEIVGKATHGIDVHTGAIHRCNLPQVRCDPGIPENVELAKAFGAAVVVVKKSGAGTLRAAANKKGIPNILLEVGEALRFDETYIEATKHGVLRVMDYLEMLEHPIPTPHTNPLITSETVWVRSRWSGLFKAKTKLGDAIGKGQVLGQVSDVFGKTRGQLRSPKTGMLIGINNNPLVYQGDAVVHIAVEPKA
jgi:predicted deacylase